MRYEVALLVLESKLCPLYYVVLAILTHNLAFIPLTQSEGADSE
jgi:hypothetical protein